LVYYGLSSGAQQFIYSPFDTPETASDGVIFLPDVASEPAIKRATAFVDGQNLFYAARNAFGHKYPNYDVGALASAVCHKQNWNKSAVN